MDSEQGAYELWDSGTGNCVGAYESLDAALRDVAEAARRYGADSPSITSLALIRLDGPEGEQSLEGKQLLQAALSRPRGLAMS